MIRHLVLGRAMASLALVGLWTCFPSTPSVQAVDTFLVSVSSSGRQGNGFSGSPVLSAYGRYVAFESWASNLVSGDNNDLLDVFVHDRWTHETTRVSVVSSNPSLGGNGDSDSPSISADGRYVAFESSASNLVSGDNIGVCDVFVHDRWTHETSRVSVVSFNPALGGNAGSDSPSISADGRYVAFQSYASNLVSEDNEGYRDIFVHDRWTHETTRVSVVSSKPALGGNYDSYHPAISADGRCVAFDSYASNLVTGDNEGHWDVFVHNRLTHETTRVSVVSSDPALGGNMYSDFPSVSADGRYVAFESWASNLVIGDNNGYRDVFVHDLNPPPKTFLVSVDSSGLQGDHESLDASISSDGTFVAFVSGAPLVAGTSGYQVYIHNRSSGETQLASRSSTEMAGNGYSSSPCISATGREVVYQSSATNLVAEDTNGFGDIFLTGFNERFVRPDGVDAGSCENPAAPCRTLLYAFDASRNGDVIKLAQGTYTSGFDAPGGRQSVHVQGGWNNDFSKKSEDASLTVINWNYSNSIVKCDTTSKNLSLKLSNLTLTHGYNTGYFAGGIDLKNSGGRLELVLENVRIVDNQSQAGAGLLADTAGTGALTILRILRSQLSDNWATVYGGGGIYVETWPGATTRVFLENSILSDNTGELSGGALLVKGDGVNEVHITNSTITQNRASQIGGGLALVGNSQTDIMNTILWNNDQINTFPAQDIYLSGGAYVHVNYSDVGNVVNYPGNPGTYVDGGMNWSSDPGFVDPANGDFHLRSDSQAIDKALCGSIVFSMSGPSTYSRVAPYFDIDNDRRPEIPPPGLNHMGCDCGADEFFTGLGPSLAPNLTPIYYLLFQ